MVQWKLRAGNQPWLEEEVKRSARCAFATGGQMETVREALLHVGEMVKVSTSI